jgi:hypothetical protein
MDTGVLESLRHMGIPKPNRKKAAGETPAA